MAYYFIDLARISDPSLVAATTAHTLGIREGGGRPPLETLKDYLANREMLLIFDNFEQVTGAAPVLSRTASRRAWNKDAGHQPDSPATARRA